MIEKRRGGNNLFDVHVGYSKFMGLMTSMDRHIIPDEYLSAMSNLRRTMYGYLESVKKPQSTTTGLPAPLDAIVGIQRPFALYYTMGMYLYDGNGEKRSDSSRGYYPHYVVDYIAGKYSVDHLEGLVAVDRGNPHKVIPAAILGFADPGNAHSEWLCVSGSRMWFTFATNKIRGSDVGDLDSADNGEGWGAWDGPNSNIMVDMSMEGYITGLFDSSNNLLIFTPAKVFKMSPYNFEGGTQKVCIYQGPNLPTMFPGVVPMYFYSNSQSVFYMTGDGCFMFDGSKPVRLSNSLTMRPAWGFHVGEYDGRMWFLGQEVNKMWGAQHNPLYAVDMQTGVWEQYDINMGDSLPTGVLIDTPTALFGGNDSSTIGASDLLVGTSCGYVYQFKKSQTNTDVLPWSFSTKAFAPQSFDQPIHPVQVMLDYIETAITSPVTITVKYDETAESDSITFNMLNAASQNHLHRGFDVPHTRPCNSMTVTVTGTGPCTILDIGVSYIPRDMADSNP
jgi:hypothetical protein